MMPKKKNARRDSLMVAVYNRVGWVAGYKVLLFLACWGHAEKQLGRPLASVDEYADWWVVSRATAFREQARFREALPEFSDPHAAIAWALERDPHVFDADAPVAAIRLGGLLS